MSSGRRFFEFDIPPPSPEGGGLGLVLTYTQGAANPGGNEPARFPRPVFIFSIIPGSPADTAVSHKRERLRAGDKILAVQGQLVIPLDGSPSLPISHIIDLANEAFRAGRSFRVKIARSVGPSDSSDGNASARSALAALPAAPIVPATSGAASSRRPFAFGFVLADVLAGVEPRDADSSLPRDLREHVRALSEVLPPEAARGLLPDLRWWSGCRPHRPTRAALARLTSKWWRQPAMKI